MTDEPDRLPTPAEAELYRITREQGRQDGIVDGRRGYIPVGEAVLLTPEEARLARDWFSLMAEDVTPDAADRALAARLEAAYLHGPSPEEPV